MQNDEESRFTVLKKILWLVVILMSKIDIPLSMCIIPGEGVMSLGMTDLLSRINPNLH
jgi:hypothetical protein